MTEKQERFIASCVCWIAVITWSIIVVFLCYKTYAFEKLENQRTVCCCKGKQE